MDIAFIGLGNMGSPIAANLAAAGHRLRVFNRTRAKALSFAEEVGAEVATSPAAAAAGAQVVITMVFDAEAMRQVYAGPSGIVEALHPGQVAVEMSTVGPAAIAWLAGVVQPTGASLVEAPVSGSSATARSASLLVMAGGDPEPVATVEPVLRATAASVIRVGALGAGARMKLALNAVVYGFNQAIAEALVLAERCGIERAVAYDVFANSAIAAPVVHYRREVFEHPGGPVRTLSVAGAAKDLRLIVELAGQVGAPASQTVLTAEVMAEAEGAGFAGSDVGEIAEFLRRQDAPGAPAPGAAG